MLLALPSDAANAEMVSQFEKTCVTSRSKAALTSALSIGGWRPYATVAQSKLGREIALVAPILEAQRLAADYTVYRFDGAGRHFELALSETKKPVNDSRKLIGCSLYDFAAIEPVDSVLIDAFAPTINGQRSTLQDVQVEKWNNAFGAGSEMRTVFVPPDSPMKAPIGFGGMMLGTAFLDGAN